MNGNNHKRIEVFSHLFESGTPAFPAYLSMGEEGMTPEGGTLEKQRRSQLEQGKGSWSLNVTLREGETDEQQHC